MDLKPTLVLTKGKWYVCVTIPPEYRASMKGQKQLKLSTGTSDKALAERLLMSKANQLAEKITASANTNHPVIKAAERIVDLTSELHYGYGAEQLLDPTTFEDAVLDMRGRAAYVERLDHMISDAEDGMIIGRQQELVADAMEEFEVALVAYKQQVSQNSISATESKLLSVVLKDWMSVATFKREKTKNTYKSHVIRYIQFRGDVEVQELTKADARAYVKHLAQQQKAHSTIETAVASLRGLLNFAEEAEFVEENVFSGLRLKGIGKPAKQRATFSKKQLAELFCLPMKTRDMLCLKLLATTGMRLDEAALSCFEDCKIDEDTGIRYFDLTSEQKILKNEGSSRRIIPVPDIIFLPKGKKGRLFDYSLDRDGKAENAASKALLRQIRKVRRDENENLVVHSLRHTYKDMLRDAGVPRDIQDFLLGHAPATVGDSYGQGFSLTAKKQAIDLLDWDFLKTV